MAIMNRSWTGLALLLASALDYFGGAAILAGHPAQPLDALSGLGLVLVFSSLLLLVGGIGELLNWVAGIFKR